MNDLTHWLERLGLGHYARLFAESDIDFEVLPRLTENDLKELGLTLGHRVKLKTAIQSLSASVAATPYVSPSPHQTGLQPGEAERRQVTVLFCDLVGSTSLSVGLDPEDYRDLIRAYQDACARVVARFDGFIAKFMGDGVLIYFGWPRAHEDDAERAIDAGLAISDAVRTLIHAKSTQLATRIGIATGRVVVGDIVGEGAAQEAVIAGEAPNLAARLQMIAVPDAIVISDATHSLAGSLFECARLPAQSLKGFDGPVTAWQVGARRVVESRFEAMRMRAPTTFVGREEEIEIVQRRWQRACSGEGQVVLLVGEPGIGKSRLVSELEQLIGKQPHKRVRYQCSPYHTNSALYPVIEQLERAASIQRSDSSDHKLEKLENMLAQWRPQPDDSVPLIAPLLSIPLGSRYAATNVSPQRQKQLALAALVDLLASQAEQRPVLVHWEDTHWIDPSSRELLDLIVARAASLSALVFVNFRPEFTQAWTGQSHVTLLALNRLTGRTCADLASQTAGAVGLPVDIIDEIVRRADGVPLFVEEMTKTVLEARTTAGMEADGRIPIAIPASIEDSLMARLDGLGPIKEVAQTAAVLGRTFRHDVLAAVAALDDVELDQALDRLISSGLVYRSSLTESAAYEFKHALIRDAAYQSLLKGRRQRLHTRIADVLDGQFSAVAEPELLAYHYTEGGRPSERLITGSRQASAQCSARPTSRPSKICERV